MPKVSQSYLDARREQILDAAIVCFSREGFHRATMQDVVSESGMSPGAIYNYFASKDEIIAAIASDRLHKERLLFDAARNEHSFAAAVTLLRDAYFGELKNAKERRRRRVSIQLWAEAQRNRKILKLVRKNLEAPHTLLRELLASAQNRGEISKSVDADSTARFLVAVFYGLVLQVEWGEKFHVGTQVDLLETFLSSLSPKKIAEASLGRQSAMRAPNQPNSGKSA
jgi:AcrR family transcriptional regulator